MTPKRFWGTDMSAALRAVRSSLGPDALILESRDLSDASGGGVEITAVGESRGFAAAPSRPAPAEGPIPVPPRAVATIDNTAVRDEIAALRSLIYWLAPSLNQNSHLLQSLVQQGLTPENIARLSEAMQRAPGQDEREKLLHVLVELIPSGGRIDDAVDRLVLVGPTGVGKSTNLIKLTVFESQRLTRRIGWINTDQRPLAGGDPLALYATILGVRYETAENNKELKRALERLSDCDLVLIDTPGVNPRAEAAMKDLARLLHGLPALRRMLVCSAATNGADLADWVKRYDQLGVDSLFFTKLDECRYLGPLVNTALSAGYPLSYIALGQNLAGDLENARPEVLISLLLTGGELDDPR
jgi:flagellar biosynthesis protein FlhF